MRTGSGWSERYPAGERVHIGVWPPRLLEDLPARATLPAFSAMKGGADGLLWIREYPNPLQEEVVWVGFTEAWERKMRITVPVGMPVLDIAEDRVLARA